MLSRCWGSKILTRNTLRLFYHLRSQRKAEIPTHATHTRRLPKSTKEPGAAPGLTPTQQHATRSPSTPGVCVCSHPCKPWPCSARVPTYQTGWQVGVRRCLKPGATRIPRLDRGERPQAGLKILPTAERKIKKPKVKISRYYKNTEVNH